MFRSASAEIWRGTALGLGLVTGMDLDRGFLEIEAHNNRFPKRERSS